MNELKLKTFVCGELLNNCYLIFNQESKKAFLVDAPIRSREFDEFIKKENLTILFIALTHAHFDHIGGLDSAVPFYIHKSDVLLLKETQLNGSAFFNSSITVKEEPKIYNQASPLHFERHKVEVLHTPGHTPGSVSLRIGNWLFSGDALFFNSVGRTDIPLASHETLISSIKEKILTLPDDTAVYPGHGASTTVGREKKENPYLTD